MPITFDFFKSGLHPDDRPCMQAAVERSLDPMLRPGYFAQYRIRRHDDGEERWIEATGTITFHNDTPVQMIGTTQDITDRRLARDALLASEERLRLAQDAGKVGLWDWNIETGAVTWSDQYYENWGLDRSVQPSHNAFFIAAIHENDREQVQTVVAAALAGANIGDIEFRVPQSDGSIRWIHARGEVIRDEDGKALRMIGVALDISARKEAEDAAKDRELKLTRFAETDVIGVLFGDIHGGIASANNEFLRIIGYSRDDLECGRVDWRNLTPPEWLPLDEERIAEAQAKGFCTRYEKEYIRPDGQRVPVLIGYSLVGDASVAIILDLTEQKRTEKALRQSEREARRSLSELQKAQNALAISEERFRSFAEETEDVVWVLDAVTLKHEYINRAYETIWGESRDLVLQDPMRWVDRVHPDDRDRVLSMPQTLRAGQSITMEYRVVRPDGSTRWLVDSGFPIFAPDGTLKRTAGLVQDITERKRAEEQQKLLLAELNHRVKNTLATVQSLMIQSSRGATDVKAFRKTFEARLIALAKTHNLLTREHWAGAPLQDIVMGELAPYYTDDARIMLKGNPVWLSSTTALSLGLIFHELATNAAKYGALSTINGKVTVDWEIVAKGDKQWLSLRWYEREGPVVVAPTRRGFGSVLIERSVRDEMNGESEIAFNPEGVTCTLTIPLLISEVL